MQGAPTVPMEVFPHLPLSEPGAVPPRTSRVCIASYELLGPSRNGGIGTGYSSLAEALTEAGHQVVLLYLFGEWCENGSTAEWQAYYGSRGIRFCPLPALEGREPRPQSMTISYEAYQWLRTREFDVIHFPELLGHAYYSVLAKHQGLDFANTLLCVGAHSPISWIREISRELPLTADEAEIEFMERQSVALADVVISPSQYLLNWMKANGWRFPHETYVQQYVPSLPLQALWKERRNDAAPRRVTGLTFFGRLEERKGLSLFCDAVDLLLQMNAPRFSVSFLGKRALVGGRDSIDYIGQRARRWPVAWKIISDRTQSEALTLLHESDRVAVIPSLADNLPNAVLECIWSGIPFLASRAGGIPEAIAPEDLDYATFAADPRALAERLELALREGIRPSRPAIDPISNKQRWLAWHTPPANKGAAAAREIEVRAERPLVSVCVAQPERPELLRRSLLALQAQTWPNCEIIVTVADGASDSETELEPADTATGKPRLRTISQRLGSATDVRDRAAARADGEFLLFLDPHTVPKPEQIATLVGVAEHSGADVLTSFLDTAGGTGDENVKVACRLFLGPAIISGAFHNYYGCGAIFVRKSAFLALGGFAADDWRPCDEWEFLAKAALSNLRMEVVPRALACYRVDDSANPAGISQNGNGSDVRRLRPYMKSMPPVFGSLLKHSLTLSRVNGHVESAPPSDIELLEQLGARFKKGGNRRIGLLLKRYLDYNTARLNLPERGMERLSSVARQLFKGNYHRFAHGFGSALRDLRRTPDQIRGSGKR